MTGRRRRGDPTQWTSVADGGLQQERTALAWERTAISMMVAGILLARYGASRPLAPLVAVGIAQTVVGGAVLIWAGLRYVDLHGPIRSGEAIVHPGAARAVGLVTVTFTATALVSAAAVIL